MPRTRLFQLIALLACAACGADVPRTTVERADSAGIVIVRSHGPDVPLPWSFTAVFTLGGEDAGPESFFRVTRRSVATDAAGNLYILDRGNRRVVVFDSTGHHLRTFGREGGGPGEFGAYVMEIDLAPDGSIHVSALGNPGIVRFAADGSPLPTRRLDIYLDQGAFAATDFGLVVQTADRSGTADQVYDLLRVIPENGDTATIASFPRPQFKPIEYSCVALSGMPPLFTPSLVWAAEGARVLVSMSTAYVIDLYDGTRRAASFRRDLPPRAATRDLALRQVGEKFEVRFGSGGSCVVQPGEVVEKQGYADTLPALGALAIAPDGTIWVRRYAVKREEPLIDVLAPDGAYLGTLPAGSPFPAAFLPDGSFAAIESDALDVQRVVVYRVERAAAVGEG